MKFTEGIFLTSTKRADDIHKRLIFLPEVSEGKPAEYERNPEGNEKGYDYAVEIQLYRQASFHKNVRHKVVTESLKYL